MHNKLLLTMRIPDFRTSCTHRFPAYTPFGSCIHASIVNIRPTFRQRSAQQCEHIPAVSPRCLESQEAHLSMKLARCHMRGTVCCGPPPNIVRGASSGERLGGRPLRHHQSVLPPASKNLRYKKPPNASHVRPLGRPDRREEAQQTTEL